MLTEDNVFDRQDFRQKSLPKGEYEYCTFTNCDFSNSNLSEIKFLECVFSGCNLSMVKLGVTVFRDIEFVNCKMLGLNFEHCSEFGFSVSFTDCILNHSSFYKRLVKNTVFKNCKLVEVDLTDADLTNAVFDNCDLANAKFENTNLEKADFHNSFNYTIDPEINRIKKARFSLSRLPGLLSKYNIEIE